jgi:hypothetical protein
MHLSLNHHHELVWLAWLLLCCNLTLDEPVVAAMSVNPNAHVRSLVVAAYAEGRIARRPPVRLGSRLATTDANWLLHLVGRATGSSRAAFSGGFAAEFEHLAQKSVKLIDIQAHIDAVRAPAMRAISRTRYGYDNDDDEEDGWGHFIHHDGDDDDHDEPF